VKLKEVETMLVKHLEESGQIRSDIAWLKKSFWALVSLMGTDFVTHLFHLRK
jgi:hypothetical protein